MCVQAISLSQATMAVFLKCLQLIEMQNLYKLEEKKIPSKVSMQINLSTRLNKYFGIQVRF